MIYLDSAYIAKCYLREPGSDAVFDLVEASAGRTSLLLALAEVQSTFHRPRTSACAASTSQPAPDFPPAFPCHFASAFSIDVWVFAYAKTAGFRKAITLTGGQDEFLPDDEQGW